MPSAFAPSFVARNTNAILDRGQPDLPLNDQVLVGQRRSDPHNEMFRATAEGRVAPFLARNMAKPLPDPRDYVVFPNGTIAYKTPEAQADAAKRTQWPNEPRSVDNFMDATLELDYRHVRPPRTSAKLSFPPAADFFGHNKTVSVNTTPYTTARG